MERVEKKWKKKHGEFKGEEEEIAVLRKGIDPEEIDLLEEEDDDTVDATGKKKDQRKLDKKFRALIPSHWKLFSEHYFLARDLTSAHYTYLLSLPLILHIPSEHAFVVHAGMLPYDITKRIDGARQPLARVPRVRHGDGSVGEMREKQEVGVLERVPQNGEPWALLNMRNVLHDHSIIRFVSLTSASFPELTNIRAIAIRNTAVHGTPPGTSSCPNVPASTSQTHPRPTTPSTTLNGFPANQ